jgi:hypothetical protein
MGHCHRASHQVADEQVNGAQGWPNQIPPKCSTRSYNHWVTDSHTALPTLRALLGSASQSPS